MRPFTEETLIETDPARARRVELILQRVERLPTLSQVARRALELGSDDEIEMSDLVGLVESDPALTGRVLALLKKTDRALSSITTVERAVTLLGIDAIRSAVLSIEVCQAMNLAAPESETFDYAGYWRHVIGVACASELLAKEARLPGAPREHAFVAGLLSGLGRLVLERVLPSGYGRVVSLARTRGVDSAQVESELIGLDHHTAGKRVAEHWGLPHALQDVIWLHGHPTDSIPEVSSRDLIALVRWARMLCRSLMVGFSGDFSRTPTTRDIVDESGLDAELIERVALQLPEAVSGRCEALGIEQRSGTELMLESVQSANVRLGEINEKLESRARMAVEQARVLAAIEAFCSKDRAGSTVSDALRDVVASARTLFGDGAYAAVFQSRRGESWELHSFGARGEAIDSAVESPPADSGGTDLADVFAGDPGWVGSWLSDALRGAPEARRARALPLWSGSERGSRPTGSCSVLFSDRAMRSTFATRELIDVLASAWGSAVRDAAQHEGARRISERLAESQRRLSAAQHELAQRESMAQLDEFSAGCAHEMNNPLTVIKGEAQMLRQEAGSPAARERSKRVSMAAQQISDLVTSLQLLASPPEPHYQRTNVIELTRDAVKAARERTTQSLKVRFMTDDHVPLAMVDREFLSATVIELLLNAVGSGSRENTELAVHADPVDNRLEIRVRDAGRGMDAEALRHAFDPFFSQRPAGRGTGLGLTRARRFVELMDGTIRVESEAGRGTNVTVTLPITRPGSPGAQLASDEGLSHEAA